MSTGEPSKMALYKQIETNLRQQITNGEFQAGDKVPTESELMAQYGVSRMTAKKALDELVELGLIERHPGKGSFVLDTTEVTRDPQKPLTIGLIVPKAAPSFGPTLVSTLAQTCQAQNINLLYVETSHNSVEEESRAIRRLRASVDGLIVWPVPGRVIGTEILKLLIDHFPVVLLDRYIQDMNASYIVSDNEKAVNDLLALLYAQGHRSLCLVPKENLTDTSIQDRVAFAQTGWNGKRHTSISVMHTRGIHFDREEEVNNEKERIKARIQNLLETTPDVSAFFVTEYYPATLVYDALVELGYRVPEDFSIICYDSPVFYTEHIVRFTHVQQDEVRFANDGLATLLKLVDGQGKDIRILEPAPVIEGETTGPVRA